MKLLISVTGGAWGVVGALSVIILGNIDVDWSYVLVFATLGLLGTLTLALWMLKKDVI